MLFITDRLDSLNYRKCKRLVDITKIEAQCFVANALVFYPHVKDYDVARLFTDELGVEILTNTIDVNVTDVDAILIGTINPENCEVSWRYANHTRTS
jgi:hypothetical protein